MDKEQTLLRRRLEETEWFALHFSVSYLGTMGMIPRVTSSATVTGKSNLAKEACFIVSSWLPRLDKECN